MRIAKSVPMTASEWSEAIQRVERRVNRVLRLRRVRNRTLKPR